MNASKTTVVALFENESSARNALEALVAAGFNRDDIHLSSRANYTGDVAAGGAGMAVTGQSHPEHHTAGFLGWLSSIFGGNDYADQNTVRYDEAARRGGYVVAVSTDEQTTDRAADILNQYDAVDVDQHAARYGYAASEEGVEATGTAAASVIPVVEEELQVGKRNVQRGGVRIFSRVIEEPVSEEIRLREETVNVERRPVDRPVTDADRSAMRDETIEVTEMAEEPVIQKQARVVEEVRIGKDVSEQKKTVSDTVRRTEVTTEKMGAESNAAVDTGDFRRDFATRYGSTGATYETYAPAYDYGYSMAGDARYQGKSWADAESTLRTDYLRNNPNSTWDKVKGAVQYGWEKVSGKR